MWAGLRTLRIADGPDEVHLRDVARLELRTAGGATRREGDRGDRPAAARRAVRCAPRTPSTSRPCTPGWRRGWPCPPGLPEVRQFGGGASNLTFLLRYPGRDLVLRRPPAGRKAASAHDMHREHEVQRLLAP